MGNELPAPYSAEGPAQVEHRRHPLCTHPPLALELFERRVGIALEDHRARLVGYVIAFRRRAHRRFEVVSEVRAQTVKKRRSHTENGPIAYQDRADPTLQAPQHGLI